MGSTGMDGASTVACGGSTLFGEPLDGDRRRSLFMLQALLLDTKRQALHFARHYGGHPQCIIAAAG
jgi:hypothetical protein